MPFDGAPPFVAPLTAELLSGHLQGFAPCGLATPGWCVAGLLPGEGSTIALPADRLNARFRAYMTDVRFIVLNLPDSVVRKAVWKFLRRNQDLPPSFQKSAICGWSLGGFSVALASFDPSRVKAAKEVLQILVEELGVSPACIFDCPGFHLCMAYVAPQGLRTLLGRLPDCDGPMPPKLEASAVSVTVQ